jgi:hypothetical protein
MQPCPESVCEAIVTCIPPLMSPDISFSWEICLYNTERLSTPMDGPSLAVWSGIQHSRLKLLSPAFLHQVCQYLQFNFSSLTSHLFFSSFRITRQSYLLTLLATAVFHLSCKDLFGSTSRRVQIINKPNSLSCAHSIWYCWKGSKI